MKMSSLVGSIFGDGSGKPTSSSLFVDRSYYKAPGDTQPLKNIEDEPPKPTQREIKRRRQEDERKRKAKQVEQELRTVFVGNIPLTMTRKELAGLFSGCGVVESTRIRSAPTVHVKVAETKSPKLIQRAAAIQGMYDSSLKASAHGYVVFTTKGAAAKALGLNNKKLEDGRHIRVDTANPSWMENTKRTIFVGNLPHDDPNLETDLQRHIAEHCGCPLEEVEGVRIIRERFSFKSKGFGYVLLNSTALQLTALRCIPGTRYKGRELRATPCRKDKSRHNRESAPNEKKRKEPNDEANVVGALRRLQSKEQATGNKRPRKAKGPPAKKLSEKVKNEKKMRKIIQNKVNQVRNERRR